MSPHLLTAPALRLLHEHVCCELLAADARDRAGLARLALHHVAPGTP